jgi:hypothetical protein
MINFILLIYHHIICLLLFLIISDKCFNILKKKKLKIICLWILFLYILSMFILLAIT